MNKEKTVWEEFDKEFGNLGNFRSDELGILNFDASKLLAIKTFIRTRFVSKAELREKIKGLYKTAPVSLGTWEANGYFAALDAVLALLNEQTS